MKYFVTTMVLALTAAVDGVALTTRQKLKPRRGVREKLTKPENFSQAEWNKIAKLLDSPKLDYQPTGKLKVPETAGDVAVVGIQRQIVGGKNAARGLFPWMASIIIDYYWFCGGSLIHSLWVLTAAHCAQGSTSFEVMLGTYNIDVDEVNRVLLTSKLAIVHEKYNAQYITNDVALIKLPSAVTTPTAYINLVRLPRIYDSYRSFVGYKANVSGWGLTSDTGYISSTLVYMEVPVIPNINCSAVFGTNSVSAATICTSGVGIKSTCAGDSGGPLVYKESDGKWTQIGIVSYGVATCMQPIPSAYARVSSYLGWISNKTSIAIRP